VDAIRDARILCIALLAIQAQQPRLICSFIAALFRPQSAWPPPFQLYRSFQMASRMTVKELRAELAKRSLETTGLKAALVRRDSE
jgi:hypothetical protein